MLLLKPVTTLLHHVLNLGYNVIWLSSQRAELLRGMGKDLRGAKFKEQRRIPSVIDRPFALIHSIKVDQLIEGRKAHCSIGVSVASGALHFALCS
jgi:hypothetical protein